MRFLTSLLLLPLLTVSGLTHHHDEQHVLDAASESDTQSQSQSRVDVDVNVASEAMTYQELEQQHTAQINQELQELSTLEDQLQAEQDTQEQQRLWPFSKTVLLRDDNLFLNRLNLKVDNLLMKEPTLIKATQNPPSSLSHVALNVQPYSISELKKIDIVHDEWIRKLGNWFVWKGGYEFNWARMWEPVTKQYRSYVPSVKSQRCGTCWDFATSAMISSNLAVRYGIDRPIQWDPETVNPISLSEGELFECTGRSGIDDVCNGNWIQNAAARVNATGIAQNADYTFSGKLEVNANRCRGNACGPKCAPKPPNTNAPLVKNCNYWPQKCPSKSDKRRSNNPRFSIDKLVTVSNPSKDPANPTSPWIGSPSNPLQIEQMRDLLRTKGPLGFYFRVESGFGLNGNDVWPNNGAVYDTPCTGVGINHAMVIVGYGRTGITDKQPLMNYWIVLNSWGNWSTDGFIKIKAGVNLCGAENIAFYPELPPVDVAASDPCASQPSEKKKLQCFLSLCDNTMLSSSRYCQSKGRSNFCKRIVDTKTCPKECGTCPKTLDKAALKACKAKYNTGKCSAECKMYDKMCRITFNLDDKVFWKDILLPLNTKIAEAKIGVPIDNMMIAKVDPKPIKTPFSDIFRGQGNQQIALA